MYLTRRTFHRLAIGSSACALLPAAVSAAEELPAFQPFREQTLRLLTALESIGVPLSESGVIRSTLQEANVQASALEKVITLLDRHVLLQVTINPEMRLAVARGNALAELVQGGWRTFLVKVFNNAATTATLKIKSPQGAPVGRHSSLAIEGVHDFTNGAVDEVEARARWIAVDTFDSPPMTPALSGLSLEYRILQLYSRDAGDREATLQADAGYGEQDLGYRSSVPILFHCTPAMAIRLKIFDEAGKPSIAAITVRDSRGRVYPPQTKRELPDLNFQPQVYRYSGETLRLPEGDYTVEYTRGPEYLTSHTTLRVARAVNPALQLQLKRWVIPRSQGYYSGDTHIHAAGCSHYESPTEGVVPIVMERQVDGEALDLGSVLNWGPGFEYQKQFFTGHAEEMHHISSHPAAGEALKGMPHDAQAIAAEQTRQVLTAIPGADAPEVRSLVRYDIEVSGFPSSHCGHLVLLQLRDQQYPGTRGLEDWPSWNIPILQWAKAQGAVVGYAHSAHGLVVDSTQLPNYIIPPFNSMGANEYIVDVTHPGVIDFISGCDLWPFAEMNIWYHTLNCGFRTAFAGETDFPCLTDACVGGGRSYVALPRPAEGDDGYALWLKQLLNGSSYFGDGRSHLFQFAVEGHSHDQRSIDLPGGATEVNFNVTACARLEATPTGETRRIQHASLYDRPYWHLERARVSDTRQVPVELLINGEVADRKYVEADGNPHPVRFSSKLQRSSWAAVRIYPSSHTNPIFLSVDGKPVRASRRSAEWCRKSVDVCWQQKSQRIRPEELQAAAAAYDHARKTYDAIILESAE
ncbi:CehA/McbA family metallohydrolase [Terriglobus albidus]|uniref:CehA/McbA family metallohydrolase n=1 Tax=Terriglobus albidus TaxID=1592106 RepID=UPI0021E063D1|nr:CehA/McbA family metallohydrolase [Terriglobus albidus]